MLTLTCHIWPCRDVCVGGGDRGGKGLDENLQNINPRIFSELWRPTELFDLLTDSSKSTSNHLDDLKTFAVCKHRSDEAVALSSCFALQASQNLSPGRIYFLRVRDECGFQF